MFTLYYAPAACSFAVHAALEKTGAPFRLERVDLKAGAQNHPDYLAVNPRARVPTLADGEHRLGEVLAILLYLERRFPQAQLLPAESWARGKALEWMSFLSSTVHPLYRAYWRTHWFSEEGHAHPPIQETAAKRILAAMAELDAAVAGRDALVGAAPGAADYYALVFAQWTFRAFTARAERLAGLRGYVQSLALHPPIERAVRSEGIALLPEPLAA
jgi:glutathione S-transferase